ncbi:MAG: hypothetical protein VCA36_01680, partial [Opitutales bacterium]
MTEEQPVPRCWHPDFIDDYRQAHPDKQVAVLRWSPDDDVIIRQLVDAIESKANVILSELLPDELPERVLIKEHEYYEKHYVFVPPQFETEINPSPAQNTDGSKPLLVFNSKTSKQFAIGNLSEKTSAHIVKVLETSEVINVIDVSNQQFEGKDLFDAIEGASKTVTLLENPQESLALRMIAARMGNPCCSLNDWAGSPFRYACVGLVPEMANPSGEKSLRDIITEAISVNNGNSETIYFSEETLILCTRKYSKDNFDSTQDHNEHQWFAKDLYAIEQDNAFWREPWTATKLDITEVGRLSILGRIERKVIHSLLQNVPKHIQESNGQKELYSNFQEDALAWYLRHFLYKNKVE